MEKTRKNPPKKVEGKSGRPTKLDFTIVRKVIEVLQID
jgi:hypothetical protein